MRATRRDRRIDGEFFLEDMEIARISIETDSAPPLQSDSEYVPDHKFREMGCHGSGGGDQHPVRNVQLGELYWDSWVPYQFSRMEGLSISLGLLSQLSRMEGHEKVAACWTARP